MSKEATKPLNLKSKFVELSSGWTAHGYHNIYRSEHWPVRIMWILFFFLASILCGFMVYKSINDYLQFDVVTKIRDYSEVPANYPVITFCNINPLIKNTSDSLIKDFLDKEFNISYIEQDYYLNQTISNTTSLLSYKVLTSYEKLMSAKTSSINKAMDPAYGDENRKSLWYNLDQLLIYCKYNGKLCNQSDFAWLYMYDYGNCFQFNTGKDVPIKKSYVAGNKNGLYLELFGGEAESFYSLQADSGIMVFIHNQTSKPVPSEGIRVNPGSLTTIILSKVFTHSEPSPYSDCKDLAKHRFNRVFYDAILKSNFSYTQKECFELCLQQSIIKKCLCYNLRYLKLDDNVLPCLNKTELECTDKEYLSFIDNDIDETCKDYCPLECDSEYFEYKISSSHFPTSKYKNILLVNPVIKSHSRQFSEEDQLEPNVSAINIYYENLKYTLISESAKATVFDIFASVGGTISLCIGTSVLSFFEIVELFMELFLAWSKSGNSLDNF